MKTTTILASLLIAVASFAQDITNRTIKVCYDGSISNAHAYAWDYPNGAVPSFGENAYHDLGLLTVGYHEFVITNVPGGGGELIICDPSIISIFRQLSGLTGYPMLQVWVYDADAGINFYADAWQYETWEPDPFICPYVDGLIPDDSGSWTNGVPDCAPTPLAKPKRGKGHRK